MSDPVAAGISFFALGANLLGAGLLLLFSPGSREVRWYAGFVAVIMVWLLAQGVEAVTGVWGAWDLAYAGAVTLLPAAFVASVLSDEGARSTASPWLALAVGVVVLPFGVSAMTGRLAVPGDTPVFWVYQIAGWTGGSLLLSRSRRARDRAGEMGVVDRVLNAFLLVLVPLAVALAFALGARDFFRYGMPLGTVAIQFAIFVGVTRMRFYDIEVRAARSGELAARAAETERLAVLGELAATVAHEVRNPLTGVRSLAQQIAEDDVDEERRRLYAGVILEEIGRVERMVANLLDLSRRNPEPAWDGRPTPLGSLFRDLELLVDSRSRKAGVEVEMEADDDLAASAPRPDLAQALLNLVLNAIRHAPEGTRVTVRAERGNGDVAIRIRDQGAGVPEEEREEIFEPFRSSGDGAGLGLSVVRRIGRRHGWRIAVADAPGGGAEFTLRIEEGRRDGDPPEGRADEAGARAGGLV